MPDADEKGWPHDPLLRVLRAVSVVSFLGLLVIQFIPGATHDLPTIAFLIGAILIQLLYDVNVNLPGLATRRRNGNSENGEGKHE